MTKQHPLDVDRKLALCKELISECQLTMDSIYNPSKNICDFHCDLESDPVPPKYKQHIRDMAFKLVSEIESASSLFDSMGRIKSDWPDYPEQIIKDRAQAANWKGLNVDLVGAVLFQARGVVDLLWISLSHAESYCRAQTLSEVMHGLSSRISEAQYLIDAAIAERGGASE